MWPIIGGLISGGASLLGSIFSSDAAKENTQQNIFANQAAQTAQNEFNAQQAAYNRGFQMDAFGLAADYNAREAQRNRDFQQQMSNSAYQRQVLDMKQAGLNPILAANMGGSSSPSGSSASVGAPSGSSASGSALNMAFANAPSRLAGLGEAVSRAVSSAVQVKTMDKMSDEMANLKTDNEKLIATIKQIGAQTATEQARKKNVEAQTENVEQDTIKTRYDVPRQKWEAIKYLDLSNIPDVLRKAGNIGSWSGEKAGDILNPIVSTASGVRKLLPSVRIRTRSGVDTEGKGFDEFWKERSGLFR